MTTQPVLRRHTSHHGKDESGRSPVVEGYIRQSITWAIEALLENHPLPRTTVLQDLRVMDMGADYGYALEHLTSHLGVPKPGVMGIDPFFTHNPWEHDLRRLAMDDPALPNVLGETCYRSLFILNHTLEHVPNPYAVMQNIHRLINKPLGTVFIAVPHCDDDWATWGSHYTIWNERWLRRFMEINGFSPLAETVAELRPGHREVWGLYRAL